MEVDGKNAVKVKCGRSAYDFIAIDAAEYPELPEMDEAEAVSLPQKTLKAMIDETIFAVSTNESRPVYMGSMFEIGGGQLTVVSVDGYRLALRREKLEGSGRDGLSFIIPGAALQDISRICADSEDAVLINVGAKHVTFTIGETVVISRRLEGDFLNYRRAVPDNFRFKMKISREEFLSVVDRVSLVVDEKIKSPLRLVFGDGNIDFACVTPVGPGGGRLHLLRRGRRHGDRLQRPLSARRAARRPGGRAGSVHQHRLLPLRFPAGGRRRRLHIHGAARAPALRGMTRDEDGYHQY